MEQKSVINVHVSKNKHLCIVTSKEDGQILYHWIFRSIINYRYLYSSIRDKVIYRYLYLLMMSNKVLIFILQYKKGRPFQHQIIVSAWL